MLRHTLLMIIRNFNRFRSTFLINLIGLSTGLACAILIYLWVADELAVDKFHKHRNRIVQVMTNQNRPDEIVTLGYGPGQLPDEMPAEYPEIEYAVGSSGIGDGLTLSVPDKNITVPGQFAGEEFFNMFSYPLIHGDADQVLADKKSIVLSEDAALALFNTTENIIGKMIKWQVLDYSEEVLVSGVFQNVPSSSSLQFDFLLSWEVSEQLMREDGSLSWGNHNAITYLLLKEKTNLDTFNAKIEDFIKARDPGTNLTIFAKPYSENYLYGKYENGKLVGGRITYVKLFSAIAVFIVVIACINFMNLATAKASLRMKEVGVKKAMGAPRKTLMMQYLMESLVMAFLSMALALLVVDLFLPQFNVITGKNLALPFDGPLMLALSAITLFTGVLAGAYPALYLSRFNPAIVLKGRFTLQSGGQWARTGLVIFQFTLSIIFIVSVWVIYQQLHYVQTKHLGYNKEHIIYFKLEGNGSPDVETFLDGLKDLPGVVNASAMWGSVAGQTSFTTGSFDWKGKDPDKIIQFEHLGIYYDMIELLDLRMKEGRSFSRNFPSDSSAIILNETAIRVMGLEDPIGERFNLWGNDYTIIGVTKDFHFTSLHEEVKPFFFRITPDQVRKVMVRMEAGKETETLATLASFYKKFNPGYSFDYN
ncbi:MAG: ABC transporter permease, partial [Chryseosolibacter sp.]